MIFPTSSVDPSPGTRAPRWLSTPDSAWNQGSTSSSATRTVHGSALLRQYFPKGTDLARHSRSDLDAVALALNSRPRKTLAWKTPAEALDQLLGSA